MAKVLGSRSAKFMDKLISPNQSVILKGGFCLMGVVAMNELVDLAKKTKKECFIFKVDFKKGYDLISGSFLDYILSFY